MILVTGATGYVGGRLVTALERQGLPVRCLARHPEHLRARVAATTEIVGGDVLDPASLGAALAGVQVACYRAIIRQTALFDPFGLAGLAYWWLVYPLHQLVFRGMLRAIVRAASAPPPHEGRVRV